MMLHSITTNQEFPHISACRASYLHSSSLLGSHTTMCADDTTMMTIYFALRAYRDSLNESLMRVSVNTLDIDDVYDMVDTMNADTTLTNIKNMVAIAHNSSIEYEDLMFLHCELWKVNSLLAEFQSSGLNDKLSVD